MNNYPNGSYVTWKWGQGKAEGKIINSYDYVVSREIKGSVITRNGTPDNPAYLICQNDGDEVLKLHSEIKPLTDAK
jgi:hypothetical protein